MDIVITSPSDDRLPPSTPIPPSSASSTTLSQSPIRSRPVSSGSPGLKARPLSGGGLSAFSSSGGLDGVSVPNKDDQPVGGFGLGMSATDNYSPLSKSTSLKTDTSSSTPSISYTTSTIPSLGLNTRNDSPNPTPRGSGSFSHSTANRPVGAGGGGGGGGRGSFSKMTKSEDVESGFGSGPGSGLGSGPGISSGYNRGEKGQYDHNYDHALADDDEQDFDRAKKDGLDNNSSGRYGSGVPANSSFGLNGSTGSSGVVSSSSGSGSGSGYRPSAIVIVPIWIALSSGIIVYNSECLSQPSLILLNT